MLEGCARKLEKKNTRQVEKIPEILEKVKLREKK